MCLDLQAQGALNINLVTPTQYGPAVRRSLRRAKELGLAVPVVWNTSGYERPEEIRANQGTVDIYLTDFKYADGRLAAALSGAKDYPEVAIAAIDAMVACAGEPAFDSFKGAERMVGGVIIRHLLLPGHLDDSKRALQMLFARYGDRVFFSIMNQYTPVLVDDADRGDERAQRALASHPELGRCVGPEEYEALLDFADGLGMQDYFWQEGGTASESFIPDFSLDGGRGLS